MLDTLLVAAVDTAAATPAAAVSSLFSDTADILKTAALFLAVLIPLLAAVWQARREGARAAAVPPTGLAVIGGALASEGAAKMYIEEFQALTGALDRLAESYKQSTEHTAEAAEALVESARRSKATLDEAEAMRRTLQEIADILRRAVVVMTAPRDGSPPVSG